MVVKSFGFARGDVRRLVDAAVAGVDVAGAGGTSLARAGAAARALECEGDVYDGGVSGNWSEGDGGDSSEEGLDRFFDFEHPSLPGEGYRVEREEPDRVLYSYDVDGRTKVAVVVAREDVPGDKRLVAYLVGDVSAEELRALVGDRLPEYMMPAAFVALDELPLTPNGKLDRRALPRPDAVALAVRHVGPRSRLEEQVARIWSEVLGVERVGVHDDFFDLGGESILATRLIARVRAELGARVAVAELLHGPTVEQLARAIAIIIAPLRRSA